MTKIIYNDFLSLIIDEENDFKYTEDFTYYLDFHSRCILGTN